MKGHGLRNERETIINFNDEDDMATIWTASESIYRKLIKRGWLPEEDRDRHALFNIPKICIKLPRKRRKLSEERRLKLAEQLRARVKP